MTTLFRDTWAGHVEAASTILVAASKRAWPTLMGPDAAFPRDDPRLCRVPVAFRRPTHAEMRRVHAAMARVTTAPVGPATPEGVDEKTAQSRAGGVQGPVAAGNATAAAGGEEEEGEDEVAVLGAEARAWHARVVAWCAEGDDAAATEAVTAAAAAPWVGDALRALSRWVSG